VKAFFAWAMRATMPIIS